LQDTSISHKRQDFINISASRDIDASTDSNDLQGIINMTVYSDHTYVYWLHLPEHNDMRIQGYIGVSNNPKQRLWEHLNDVKTNNHCNPYLSRVIKKYSDQLIQTIVFEGEKYVCYTYEEDLRPTKNIGWNLNKGGGYPPSALGRKLSTEHKGRIGKANTGRVYVCSEETKQKISASSKSKTLTEEHKQKIREARLGTTRSLETKKKLSESHKGNIPGNAKSIKTPLGTFTSLSQAAKAHKVSTQTMINWAKSKSEFQIMAHI
jgi:group I intron endonuclease